MMEPPSFFLLLLRGRRAEGAPPSSITVWAGAPIIERAVLISCSVTMRENHPYLL